MYRQHYKSSKHYCLENIVFNVSMFFNKSSGAFIIKIILSLIQVLRKNNAFIHLLIKTKGAVICSSVSKCVPSCVAILPVINSGNQML